MYCINGLIRVFTLTYKEANNVFYCAFTTAKFRQHKLGWASFILFSLILVMSLAAELIANDKPLLVKYEDAYYLPIFKTYSETTFGGVFETEADYKDPAVQELINHKGWAIWPS